MHGTVFRVDGVITLVILGSVLAGAVAWGRVIYVDDDATGVGDGLSWERAYRYLQDGLVDALFAERPAEVRVAQGLYTTDPSIAEPNGSGAATRSSPCS